MYSLYVHNFYKVLRTIFQRSLANFTVQIKNIFNYQQETHCLVIGLILTHTSYPILHILFYILYLYQNLFTPLQISTLTPNFLLYYLYIIIAFCHLSLSKVLSLSNYFTLFYLLYIAIAKSC